jgi:hypothetical protein
MKTDSLAKHYGSLTPAERVPLILAAAGRGDEQERARLLSSAPRVVYQTGNQFALALAFREVSEIHRMELLELAALFFHGFGQAGANKGKVARSILDSARVFAYMLKVNLAGWRKFCEGASFDPDLCIAHLPGGEVLEMAAELAEQTAFTPEGLLAWARRKDKEVTAAPTAENVAAGLRKLLDVRADWWG